MEEYLAAKKALDEYKEEIEKEEKLLKKEKSILPILNVLYNMMSKNKASNLIFEFSREMIEHKQKNIEELKELCNKYEYKLKEIENEIE
jgi:hypothetical protein